MSTTELEMDFLSDLMLEDLKAPAGRTFRIRTGEFTEFTSMLNDGTQMRVKLNSAMLNYASLIEHTVRSTGAESSILACNAKNVDIAIEYDVDGTWVNEGTFWSNWAKSNVKAFEELETDQIERVLRSLNLFGGQNGTRVINFQHFTPNTETLDAFFDMLSGLGVEGEQPPVVEGRRQLLGQWKIGNVFRDTGGLPMSMIEIGSSDRSKSMRNQGFVDFGVAQHENLLRVLKLRAKQGRMTREAKEAGTLDDPDVKFKLREIEAASRTWVQNLGGVQFRANPNPDGTVTVDENIVDPVAIPSGRFELQILDDQDDLQNVEFDFWINQNNNTEAAPLADLNKRLADTDF